jgi:thiol-disulfide isomerase/thioredoxin
MKPLLPFISKLNLLIPFLSIGCLDCQPLIPPPRLSESLFADELDLDAADLAEGGEQQEPPTIETSSAEQQPSRLQWLMFTSRSCGPCRAAKFDFEPWLTPSGWRISNASDAHIQLIDGDANPDLLAKYQVTSYPTFVLRQGEAEFLRHTGYPGRKALAEEFNRVALLANSIQTSSRSPGEWPVGQLEAGKSRVTKLIEQYRHWFGDQQPVEVTIDTKRQSAARIALSDQVSLEFGPAMRITSRVDGEKLSIRFARPFPLIRLNWLIPIEQPIEGLTLDGQQLKLQLPRFPDLTWRVGQ